MYSKEMNHYKVGELLNMMSFDSRQVGKFFGKINLVWQTPMTIFSAFLVLYYFSGNAIFIGLFTMALLFPLTITSSIFYTNHTADYYKIRDERGKFMNDMISGIKLIKYFGLEEKFKKMINKIRIREYDSLRRSAVYDVLQVFSQKLVILSGSIMTIVFYAIIYGNLEISHIFTTISFFNMLEKPILEFGDNIFDFGLAYVSFKRIQKFFDSTLPKKSPTPDTSLISFEEEIQPIKEDIAISIQNGTFQFETDKPVLKNINLDVKKGSLICITGKTGSGKSNLFRAISNEIEKVSGSIQVQGKIALCSQMPWLINKTIRENILFGRPYNKEKYEAVIQACQLEKDISLLPHKDLTDIIQNGSNLSGGQRHRLTLARACYADHDIYLIDSTFSALDNHLQNAIFNNCIKGLLKKKTILLITHNPTFTNYCDKVLYFDKGEISENVPDEIKQDEESQHTEQLEETEYQPKQVIPLKLPDEITIDDYRQYFSEYNKWFPVGLLFVLLFGLSKLSVGAWLSVWSKDGLGFSQNQYIVVYIIIGLFQLAMIPAHRMSFINGGMEASKKLHNRMMMKILHSPMSFFEKTKKGEIVNRFLEDQQKLDDWLPYYYNNFFIYLEYALVTICLIIIITPPAIFFIIFIGILFFGILFITRKPQHLLGTFVESSKEPLATHFESSITGLTIIKTFGSEDIFCKEQEKQIDYHHRSRWMEILMFRWTSVRMETLGSLIVFSSALFIVLLNDKIDPAVAALSITYSLTISETFTSLINVSYSAESGLISFQRVHEYTQLPTESYDIGNVPLKKFWPKVGKVEFRNSTMKYGLHTALNNLNITFGPDERIGIVGRTGSGKSSLFSALFRIVELSQGSIIIDDIDISSITLNSLRSNISIIPQEPILLAGTLRFNIDPFDKFSDYQIWKVLDDIHIKQKIDRFHLKLDDKIELFSNFSVGEKQLISVARTILSDTKIVLLDEATSNIDQSTDTIIQEIIKEKFKNKTLMIIAHRIHSVMNCDKIVVMDKGKIIEFDTPQNLLLNESSEFSKLVKKMEKF